MGTLSTIRRFAEERLLGARDALIAPLRQAGLEPGLTRRLGRPCRISEELSWGS